VENRLRHLIKDTNIRSIVVAPVPWFPLSRYVSEEYKAFADAPHEEDRFDIKVYHPRYLHIPKIGMIVQPFMLALSSYFLLKRIRQNGWKFRVIDAHYFYPDGVAATFLAKWMDVPFVVTARGTDLNLIPRYAIPKKLIKYAANKADKLITVCKALKDVLVDMGVSEKKVVPVRNGVDLQAFRPPEARDSLREELGLEGKTILSVGYLIERKGHNFIIEALQYLPDVSLLIAGTGPEQKSLLDLIDRLKLKDRVKFLGSVPHEELARYYGAADAMVLASSREGWANVLLESMACGTPVVATNIWGTPEVVSCKEAGVLVERDAPSISTGIQKLFEHYPDRNLTRKYAENFSWDDTSSLQKVIFEEITGG